MALHWMPGISYLKTSCNNTKFGSNLWYIKSSLCTTYLFFHSYRCHGNNYRFSIYLWRYIECQEFRTLKLIVTIPNLVVIYGTLKVLFVPLTYFTIVTVAKVMITDFLYIYGATLDARNFVP